MSNFHQRTIRLNLVVKANSDDEAQEIVLRELNLSSWFNREEGWESGFGFPMGTLLSYSLETVVKKDPSPPLPELCPLPPDLGKISLDK